MVILACQPTPGTTDPIDTQGTSSAPPTEGTCQLNATGYGNSFCEDEFQVPANPPPPPQQHSPEYSPNQHQVHAQSSVQYIRGQQVPTEYYSPPQPHHVYNGAPPRQQGVPGSSDFNSAVPEPNYIHSGPQFPVFNQGPYFPPQTFEIPDIEVSNSVYSLDSWASNMAAPLQCHVTAVKSTPIAPTSPESVEDSSSGDDSITLTQLSHKRSAGQALGHHMAHVAPPVVVKKPKPPKKRKKRDPNEPQKPVSAYALFFRDTQAAIKSRNPSASFGEVSKLVASMWDQLDEDHKNVYKKRTEMAKKEYLKQLAAYRASLVCQGSSDEGDKNRLMSNRTHQMPSMGSPMNPMGSSPLSHPIHNGLMGPPPHSMAPPLSMATPTSSLGTMTHMSPPIGMRINPDPFMSNQQVMVPSPKPPPMGSSPDSSMCVPNPCQNSPLGSSPWDGEYCQADISSQNRDLYSNWASNAPSSQSTVK